MTRGRIQKAVAENGQCHVAPSADDGEPPMLVMGRYALKRHKNVPRWTREKNRHARFGRGGEDCRSRFAEGSTDKAPHLGSRHSRRGSD